MNTWDLRAAICNEPREKKEQIEAVSAGIGDSTDPSSLVGRSARQSVGNHCAGTITSYHPPVQESFTAPSMHSTLAGKSFDVQRPAIYTVEWDDGTVWDLSLRQLKALAEIQAV